MNIDPLRRSSKPMQKHVVAGEANVSHGINLWFVKSDNIYIGESVQ